MAAFAAVLAGILVAVAVFLVGLYVLTTPGSALSRALADHWHWLALAAALVAYLAYLRHDRDGP